MQTRSVKCILLKLSSDDSKEDTPVPIPNTKVKLLNADSTSLETDWEGRKLLGLKMFRGSSMVEHSAVNR